MNLQVEKIAGIGEGHYCGVFNRKITVARGEVGLLVGCLLTDGEGQEALPAFGGNVFEIFCKKLETAEEGILEILENAKLAAGKYAADQPLEVSFVFAFFFDNTCYIVRQGDAVSVWVFDPPRSGEINFESGSGPVAAGQLYLIATAKFLKNFDTSAFLENVDIDYGELVDGLATDVSASGDQAELGVVFVYTKGEEGEKEPEIVPVEVAEVIEMHEESALKAPRGPKFGGLAQKVKGLIVGKVLSGGLRKKVMIIGLAVALVLFASFGFTLLKNRNKAKDAEFAARMAAATAKYNEGAAIIELNKSKAREILVGAQNEAAAAISIKSKDPGAKKLAGDIANKLKETDVSANISFSEVATVPSVNSISFAAKNIVGTSTDKLFTIDTASKTLADVKGAGGGLSSTVFDNKAFILGNGGVVRADLAGGTPVKIQVSSGGQDIGIFFGNVYVLFPSKIAKITPIEGGYAPETDYLTSKMDFLPSSRFAIDGSIWVTNGSKILKFTRGTQDNFVIVGLSGKLGELGAIYTGGTLGNLYALDKTNSALLVISKDGTYKKAYQAPEFGRALDILVTDDESTLYVAVDGKVLSASIK